MPQLVVAGSELCVGISKLSAAQRCDDDTVTFQRAWPPPGLYAPPPTVVSSGCRRPLSSPKIVASADYRSCVMAGDPAKHVVGREQDGESGMSIENDVERDIVEYLGAHYGVEPDQITDESTLKDLGVDSLGVLGIADIVETKYGVSLDDERIAGVRTLSDFTNLIASKRSEVA